MKYKTQITQDDIAAGERSNPDACPVALKLAPRFDSVKVMLGRIEIGQETYYNSAELERWIRTFDATGQESPVTLVLEYMPDLGMSCANIVR